MHPDVQKLLDLQRVDQQIARIRRDLVSLPDERARREKQLQGIQREHDAAVEALRSCELAIRTNEVAIKQSDEEIAKLQVRLNTVKNNAEYQATLLQIESVREERNRLEEEGLGQLDQVENLRAAASAAADKLADEKKVFAEFEEEAAKLTAERESQVAEIAGDREAKMLAIAPDLRADYEKLFAARSGAAVVPVEGDVCTGCYTQVTPNTKARLRGATAVVRCMSCQRILYLT